jgi:hypothetical protein
MIYTFISGPVSSVFDKFDTRNFDTFQKGSRQSESRQPDTKQSDARQPNAWQPDTRQSNTRQSDTRQSDTGQPDTRQPDTQQPDTLQPDSRQPDTEQPDTLQPDSRQPGSRQPDSWQPDTQHITHTAYSYSSSFSKQLDTKPGTSVTPAHTIDVAESSFPAQESSLPALENSLPVTESSFPVQERSFSSSCWTLAQVENISEKKNSEHRLNMDNNLDRTPGNLVQSRKRFEKSQLMQTINYGEEKLLFLEAAKLVQVRVCRHNIYHDLKGLGHGRIFHVSLKYVLPDHRSLQECSREHFQIFLESV